MGMNEKNQITIAIELLDDIWNEHSFNYKDFINNSSKQKEFLNSVVEDLKSIKDLEFMEKTEIVKGIDIETTCFPAQVVKETILYKNLQNWNPTICPLNCSTLYKMFWSGYEQGAQYVACTLAKHMNKQLEKHMNKQLEKHMGKQIEGESSTDSKCVISGGRVVEFTQLTNIFTNKFGVWLTEFEILKKFLDTKKSESEKINTNKDQINPNEDQIIEKISISIRKDIWDNISKQYAEYYNNEHATNVDAIIVLPLMLKDIDIDNTSFLTKTLICIELPALMCRNFSIIFFDKMDSKLYTLAKMIESDTLAKMIESEEYYLKEIKVPDSEDISIQTFPFNDNHSRTNITNFLKTIYYKQKIDNNFNENKTIKFINKNNYIRELLLNEHSNKLQDIIVQIKSEFKIVDEICINNNKNEVATALWAAAAASKFAKIIQERITTRKSTGGTVSKLPKINKQSTRPLRATRGPISASRGHCLRRLR